MKAIQFAARGVTQLSLDRQPIKSFRSIPNAAKELKLHKGNIYRCVTGVTETTGGYRFEYTLDVLPGEVWEKHSCGREVSNKGRVCNKRGCKTFGANRKAGYKVVYDGVKMRMVHRMVLQTFKPIENDHTLMVDHIDRDKANNCLENLRWVTAKENAANRKKPEAFKHCGTCSCF